jgi:hypothetical protein
MTVQDLRAAFNEAVRTHQAEAFALEVMPKVFVLLETIEQYRELGALSAPKAILQTAAACRPKESNK